MNNQSKQPYVAPHIDVVEFRNERGYAISGDLSLKGLLKGGIDEADSIEGQRRGGGFWGGGDDDTWF